MIARLHSRRAHRSRGQALVEFALVAPFFFMLLLAIVEFGLAVYYIQVLNNAAREGARYAIVVDPDGNDVGIMSPSDDTMRSWPPTPSPS